MHRPGSLDFIFDPIVDGLRQRAHEVIYYTDYRQFERESEALLGSTDVLVAISNFRCTRDLMMGAPAAPRGCLAFYRDRDFDEAAATRLGIVVANGQVRQLPEHGWLRSANESSLPYETDNETPLAVALCCACNEG